MSKSTLQDSAVCTNKKASFKFEILEKLECGIVLQGTEVKCLRDKAVSLDEAFARIDGGEIWLIGCHIPLYKFGNDRNHDPLRKRKLLARANEIRKLRPKVEQKGLTLVPLRIYFNDRGIAKLTLALARGKTHGDKRHALKERDDRREMERAMRRRG